MGAPSKYTWEQKKAILSRTLPPENITINAVKTWPKNSQEK